MHAHADGASAPRGRPPYLSFFPFGYCGGPLIRLAQIIANRGKAGTLRPALTNNAFVEGGEGWLMRVITRRAGRC
jgi:hypothetical protein